MARNSPNYFALGCAVLFLVLYLVLPFVSVIIPISGWNFMQYTAVMSIPVILALLMIFASLLINERISMGIGALSAVTILILLLCTRGILLNNNAFTAMAMTTVTQAIGVDSRLFSSLIPVSIGIGGILSMVLCIAYVVLEVTMGSYRKRPVQQNQNPFPF